MQKTKPFLWCVLAFFMCISNVVAAYASPAYVLFKTGAAGCGPCHEMNRDIFYNPEYDMQLRHLYVDNIYLDVDAVHDPLVARLLDTFDDQASTPRLIVVRLDIPVKRQYGDRLTTEWVDTLITYGKVIAVRKGYSTEDKAATLDWLVHRGEQTTKIYPAPGVCTNQQALDIAYEFARQWHTTNALLYWPNVRLDITLQHTERWLATAVMLATKDKDPDAKKRGVAAAQELVHNKQFGFDPLWLCSALRLDPSLRYEAIVRFAGSSESDDQRSQVYVCAGKAAEAEGNYLSATEQFYPRAYAFLPQDDSVAGILHAAQILSRYDLNAAMNLLEKTQSIEPYLMNLKKAEYYEEADLFAEAEAALLKAIRFAHGYQQVDAFKRLARAQSYQWKWEEAVASIDAAIAKVQYYMDQVSSISVNPDTSVLRNGYLREMKVLQAQRKAYQEHRHP